MAAIVANRNSPQKHVWRAHIVLLTADGFGTAEVMWQTGKSKSVVWRWQERFMQAGLMGCCATRPAPPSRTWLVSKTYVELAEKGVKSFFGTRDAARRVPMTTQAARN